MSNKLTTILLILSIILLIIVMSVGIEIGNFRILSLSELKDKNDELNGKIATVSELTSINYPENIEKLEETYDQLIIEKQRYEELSGFTGNKEKEELYETKQYDIGYLWKTFGKYATKHNLTIGMEVQKSNNGENLYNLNFAISGTYVNISQFISDIENNSDLYFRIYNFKMSGEGEIISSSFTVKDIAIDPSTLADSSQIDENTELENTIEE